MNYRVRILDRAQHDLRDCYRYIAERSSQGAANWFHQFSVTKRLLEIDPERRAEAAESEFVNYTIREVLFKTRRGLPYRILFTIKGDCVLVLRVRGPGQDDVDADDFPESNGL